MVSLHFFISVSNKYRQTATKNANLCSVSIELYFTLISLNHDYDRVKRPWKNPFLYQSQSYSLLSLFELRLQAKAFSKSCWQSTSTKNEHLFPYKKHKYIIRAFKMKLLKPTTVSYQRRCRSLDQQTDCWIPTVVIISGSNNFRIPYSEYASRFHFFSP